MGVGGWDRSHWWCRTNRVIPWFSKESIVVVSEDVTLMREVNWLVFLDLMRQIKLKGRLRRSSSALMSCSLVPKSTDLMTTEKTAGFFSDGGRGILGELSAISSMLLPVAVFNLWRRSEGGICVRTRRPVLLGLMIKLWIPRTLRWVTRRL